MQELSQQIAQCSPRELNTLLKKYIRINKRQKQRQPSATGELEKEFKEGLMDRIVGRIRGAKRECVEGFDFGMLRYCLGRLGVDDLQGRFGDGLLGGFGVHGCEVEANEQFHGCILPKSLRLLSDLQSPCCANYFIKCMPFCSLDFLERTPILIHNYGELNEQSMAMAICSLASAGQGILMLTQEHSSLSPTAGLTSTPQKDYQSLFNLLESSLKKIVLAEKHIKLQLSEIPLLSPLEIGKPKAQEQHIIRINVYTDPELQVQRKRILFYIQDKKLSRYRERVKFVGLDRERRDGGFGVRRLAAGEIYGRICGLDWGKRAEIGFKEHKCLLFYSHDEQIRFRVQGFKNSNKNIRRIYKKNKFALVPIAPLQKKSPTPPPSPYPFSFSNFSSAPRAPQSYTETLLDTPQKRITKRIQQAKISSGYGRYMTFKEEEIEFRDGKRFLYTREEVYVEFFDFCWRRTSQPVRVNSKEYCKQI